MIFWCAICGGLPLATHGDDGPATECPCGERHHICSSCQNLLGWEWRYATRFPACPKSDEVKVAIELMRKEQE